MFLYLFWPSVAAQPRKVQTTRQHGEKHILDTYNFFELFVLQVEMLTMFQKHCLDPT